MYAVIFHAEIAQLDDEYFAAAKQLRELAMTQYGCLDFVATSEGSREIAISYWPSLDHIKHWQQNAEHLQAQQQGRARWYKSYKVEVVELLRSYRH
ncbi:antibiotic biosynthesis monooxygenase family protein [Cellvibrio sp. OA-2007]|uniref:antibiotic biosynthesis monooxygenase family protein n=1 Tax=Cellvibrio sp. OA-2007 TaxID=529823 RepID=UPI000781ACED|nr:antibiotic biosynthesis monooxygenase [Cellvibrio sp. OA-2007]